MSPCAHLWRRVVWHVYRCHACQLLGLVLVLWPLAAVLFLVSWKIVWEDGWVEALRVMGWWMLTIVGFGLVVLSMGAGLLMWGGG